MRLLTDRRTAGALVAAVLALAGCDGKPKGGGTTTTTTTATGTVAGPAVVAQTPRQAAEAFLRQMADGTVYREQVADNFQWLIVGPPPNEMAKKMGPREETVALWFGPFKGAEFTFAEEATFGTATAFRGRVQFPDKRSAAFAFRLVKAADGYKVEWLHQSERQSAPVKAPADPDLAAAQDAARNFLDLVVGGNARQAHWLMNPALRRALSPGDKTDAKAGFDYGRGFLDRKIIDWRSGVVSYTLPKAELAPAKDAATFTVELDAGNAKTPYTLKIARDKETGLWLVTDFDRQ